MLRPRALTKAEAARLLEAGHIARRIWTGSELIWVLDGRKASRAIHLLDREGKLWTHYPHNSGSAGWKTDFSGDAKWRGQDVE